MEILHHDLGRDPLYKVWNFSKKNFIIFTYNEGGSFVFQDKIFSMKKGSLCFIRSNVYHYTVPEDVEKYDRSKIYLSDEYFDKIIELSKIDSEFNKIFSSQCAYAVVPSDKIEEVEMLFKRANDAVNKNKSEFLGCYFSIMNIVKKYSVERFENVKNYASKDCVSKAIEYINKNFSNEISLDEICKEVLTSKYHFCRKFKNAIGMTVMDYITYTRVTYAKKLLAEKALNVSEVCEKCGFSSISYFCQIFKAITGKTASQYKKQF